MKCPGIVCLLLSGAMLTHAEDQPRAPMPLPELVRQAAEAVQSGKTDEAVRLYREWASRDPLNPLSRASFGAALYRANQMTEARRELERAVLIEPKLAESWATLGLLYDREGEPWLALSAYSRAVHLEPREARHRVLMAVSMEKQGWSEAAESCLRAAARLAPESADVQFNLAALALRRSPPDREIARRHYAEALRLGAPEDPAIEALLNQPAPGNITHPPP